MCWPTIWANKESWFVLKSLVWLKISGRTRQLPVLVHPFTSCFGHGQSWWWPSEAFTYFAVLNVRPPAHIVRGIVRFGVLHFFHNVGRTHGKSHGNNDETEILAVRSCRGNLPWRRFLSHAKPQDANRVAPIDSTGHWWMKHHSLL